MCPWCVRSSGLINQRNYTDKFCKDLVEFDKTNDLYSRREAQKMFKVPQTTYYNILKGRIK